MSTTLHSDIVIGAKAVKEEPTITSAIIEAGQSTTEAISSWMESSARLAPVILQGFAGVLAALYLLGVCAFAAVFAVLHIQPVIPAFR
jgi:hypothetical protein